MYICICITCTIVTMPASCRLLSVYPAVILHVSSKLLFKAASADEPR